MAHPLSLLGIIHTALSIPPVAAALYSFARYRGINPMAAAGKIYLATLTLSVLTSFGLSSVVGINPGHVLGVLALLAAFGGTGILRLSFFGRLTPYLSALGLSFSFFLLLVPGINETLTRLPASYPLGASIESPIVRGTLLAWVAVFFVGTALQIWFIRSKQKTSANRTNKTN